MSFLTPTLINITVTLGVFTIDVVLLIIKTQNTEPYKPKTKFMMQQRKYTIPYSVLAELVIKSWPKQHYYLILATEILWYFKL